MSERFTIVSSYEVKSLLAIAKRHLGYIERSRSKRMSFSSVGPLPLKLEHAIVASIFSAAAIETGLNTYITLPILFIKDENIRRFFGSLVTKKLRLPVPQKLDFVCGFCPQIKRDKKLLKKVRALFEYRNAILHSPPEYIESLGLPDVEELPSEISEEDLIRYPSLTFRGTSSVELEEAFEHYKTALDFLSKLPAEVRLAEESISQTRETL
jgi:hypothetical protein